MKKTLHIDERLLREARAASQLNHPSIVTVHDYGRTDDGALFLAMELVDGDSLRDVLKRKRRLTFFETLRIIECVAQALARAHTAGIVHRDLKPENIMLPRSDASGAVLGAVSPTTRTPSRRASRYAVPMAVLLDALDRTTVRAANTSLSARKSSSTNDVEKSGQSSICWASRPSSCTGSAATHWYRLYAPAISARCALRSVNPRSSTRPGCTTRSVPIGR